MNRSTVARVIFAAKAPHFSNLYLLSFYIEIPNKEMNPNLPTVTLVLVVTYILHTTVRAEASRRLVGIYNSLTAIMLFMAFFYSRPGRLRHRPA